MRGFVTMRKIPDELFIREIDTTNEKDYKQYQDLYVNVQLVMLENDKKVNSLVYHEIRKYEDFTTNGLKLEYTTLMQQAVKDNKTYTVLMYKDIPIGMCMLTYNVRTDCQPTLKITMIVVLKEYQNNGYGRWFLENSIKLAREKHPNTSLLMLNVIYGNKRAKHLYESMGFKPLTETLIKPL